MINELKAEFKKVFTTRSTYIIFALVIILLIFFGFYVGGWHTDKTSLLDPHLLFKTDQQAINFLAIFPALMGLLLFTHEFRYNMISYSLTLSNSRSKVLAAKIIIVSIIALAVAAVAGVAAPLLSEWGMNANHLHLVHQHFYFWNIA
ncbi:MAG TPA: ABC transporter permease, partial [Candidatus Saccharimonadales bacterium]